MENSSMTARVSAFARACHARETEPKIFDDSMAEALLGKAEYDAVAGSLAGGIGYFCPGFSGSRTEAVNWAVRRRLAPTPLARAAFAENALARAAALGTGQYLILGAGYDTFALRQPEWAAGMRIFEVDRPAVLADKAARMARAGIVPPENLRLVPADLSDPDWPRALEEAGFDARTRSFCSLLGLVCYLSPEEFGRLLAALSARMPRGSALAFDYPVRAAAAPEQAELARAAGEEMRGAYTRGELERLLAGTGFLAYEHPGPAELTNRFFQSYNTAHPEAPMAADERVNCCLAVRQ